MTNDAELPVNMAKNKCEICCRPTGSGHITCGLSECQEASYYANLARNARGKKQGPAIRLATEKTATARYWAGRRGAFCKVVTTRESLRRLRDTLTSVHIDTGLRTW